MNSIIICTYSERRAELLDATLDGVRAQLLPADEIVVVVDHNPELAEALRRTVPDATVVESFEAKGLSGARNTGIKVATGDVLVFLDDDAVPRPEWLGELVAPLADPTVAGVGGRAEPAWEGGARPSWLPPELDWVVGCSFRGQAGGDVRNPIGCSMAFRADVLARVGGFATELGRVGSIPLGCEETELGLRVNRDGGRIVLTDRSVVDHVVPRSRTTVSYVLRRCFAEGVSKAVVRRLADAGPAVLGPERRYVWVLARGMRSPSRAALILAALGAAGAGFVWGSNRGSGGRS